MLVSVIMPAYNCEKYIAKSIESVIDQTQKDWELLIVDDCSTDRTAAVVQQYCEKYDQIHFVRLSQKGGPAAARNEAIKKASGKYLAFLDSDDLWLPEKLEKQIAFMQQTGAAFSATAYRQMDENGNDMHILCFPPTKTNYKKCIRLSNPIGNLTVMIDQEAIGKIYAPLIQKRNDFALWLQILKQTDFCYGMQEVLAVYRTGRKGSVSSGKLKLIKYHWQLFHDIEKHSVIRSAFEVGCWAFTKGTGIGLKIMKEKQ